jgi:hypothetical protein
MVRRVKRSLAVFLSVLVPTLLIGLTLGASGCRKEKTGVSLPRYPGGQYTPLERQEHGTYVLYGAQLMTSGEAAGIFKWYEEQLKGKGQWDKSGGGQWGGTFSQNMKLEDERSPPKPVNPDQPGSFIAVNLGGSVMLYQSVPKKKQE